MKRVFRRDLQLMHLNDFQKLIHDQYFKTDSDRGAAGTFLWFIEEVGELATAIQNNTRSEPTAEERVNLEEEFADVLAWLTTLANILDVDLCKAVQKYSKGDIEGVKN